MAPGPAPRAPRALLPSPGEDLCYLSGEWRIFQRVDGHRWSLDDLVTAWCAVDAVAAPPARILDLGCGIGSVLLMLAWTFPRARLVGIEAQATSVALARRSIAWNGCEARCAVHGGDFRDPTALAEHAPFDLVTGTPPYLAPGTARESRRPQKGPCNFEHRGGIEAYCAAAARALGPGGVFIVCEQASQNARVHAAAAAADLGVASSLPVVPRAGKHPLFAVHVLRPGGSTATRRRPPLVVRDARGERTEAFRGVRAAMGLPP